MRQALINVYKYSELSEKVKDMVRDRVIAEIDENLLISELIDIDHLLKENGIECEDYEIENLNWHRGYTDIIIHEGTFRGFPIILGEIFDKEKRDSDFPLIELTKEFKALTLKIGSQLKAVYDDQFSEENIISYIEANDLEFLNNGDLYYENRN